MIIKQTKIIACVVLYDNDYPAIILRINGYKDLSKANVVATIKYELRFLVFLYLLMKS